MRITLEIEDAEPGSIVTVIVDEAYQFDPEDPEPEEIPEEVKFKTVRAIGDAA